MHPLEVMMVSVVMKEIAAAARHLQVVHTHVRKTALLATRTGRQLR